MRIFNFFRAAIRLIASVLTLIIVLSSYMVYSLFAGHSIEKGFKLRRFFVRIISKILNLKVTTTGEVSNFSALYVINHRNIIDAFIIAGIVDVYFIAKAEVKSYPFLGRGAEMTGAIYVIRQEKNSRRAARDTLRQTLEQGLSVAVYPEGTTGTERLTVDFFPGSFEEAAGLQVPVIPIAMEYKNKSDLWLQPSTLKQFFIQFGKRKTFVKIEIHPPLISDDPIYLLTESKRLIDNSLLEMQKDWSRVWN